MASDGEEDRDGHEAIPYGGPEVLDDEVLGHAATLGRLS